MSVFLLTDNYSRWQSHLPNSGAEGIDKESFKSGISCGVRLKTYNYAIYKHKLFKTVYFNDSFQKLFRIIVEKNLFSFSKCINPIVTLYSNLKLYLKQFSNTFVFMEFALKFM